MTIKEINTRVRSSLSDYVLYIILLFCWYFLDNFYTSIQPVAPGNFIEPLLGWVYRLALVPLLLTGIYGGIHEMQRMQDVSSVRAFFNGVKTSYLRIMGANLLAIGFIFVVSIIAFISGWVEQPDLGDNKPLLAIISIPYSAMTLFWLAGVVVKRKIFQGLALGIKALFTSPFALGIGIAWGVIGFADTIFFDLSSAPASTAINAVRAGVLSLARILAMAYALAIYEDARNKLGSEFAEELETPEAVQALPGDRLVKASFGFTFVSFLPLFHLVALILGMLALKRKKQFVLSSAIACCVGGFFTIVYALAIIGLIVTPSAPANAPTYEFLADANADIEPLVGLLEQGFYQEINRQLGQADANSAERHWTYDSILALAKYYSNDLDGALQAFHTAIEKEPERSEFYYFYGIALLDNDQEDMAAEQFQNALLHEPKLEAAEHYLNLVNSTYSPSIIVSSMGFVIILLLMFTFHEYGHAFAAWKLGDDTAKNLGRLTLNPVPHLDLFGSLILPAILLFQQSEVMFGWAKPVPVNPGNFKDPKKDHMRVSFAGPAMNLIISMVCFVILGAIMLFMRMFWPDTLSLNFATPFSPVSLVGPPSARGFLVLIVFLKQFFYTSLALGVFNLIPVPPLDGSWILSGLLPQGFSTLFEQTRRFGFVIFLLLVMTPVLDYIMAIPIGFAWGALKLLTLAMGLG